VAAPDGDIAELARLVSADPALAAGVLTVSNSAAFRGVQEVETVREAIARLGFEEVARVAGAVSAKSLFNPRLKAEIAAFGPRFAELFHRSLAVAGAAAFTAMQRKGGRSDRAYLGGMLHDVGKSIALRSVAALALEGALAVKPDDPRLPLLLDRVHLEIGGEVHQEWNMPQYLTVIAVRHHDESIPGLDEFADLHAVRLAAALHDLWAGPFAARAAAEVVQSAEKLELSPLGVRQLFAELRDQAHRVAVAFALNGARKG
jgi:HD-like signal output (HDOD) protein